MAVRIHLFFTYVALFICALSNVQAYSLSQIMSQFGNASWTDCGTASEPARVHSLTVLPDPAILPGNLSISTTFTLTSAIPTDITLVAVMEKKVAGFWVKVPCVQQFGSCTFTDMCEQWTKVCPKLIGNGNIPCNCPIAPGDYTGNNIIITQNPPIVLKGDVRMTGRFVSPSAGEIACVQFIMTVG